MDKQRQPGKRTGRRKAVIRILLNLLGIGCLGLLISRIGLPQILDSLHRFRFWFPVILLLGCGWFLCQAAAWALIQNSISERISFWLFFRMKICCDALNSLLPSANIGGDAARAYLLGRQVSLRQAIPGVLVDKTLEFAGGMVFMSLGIAISLVLFKLPPSLKAPSYVCMAATLAGLSLLIYIQRRGLYPALLVLTSFLPRLRRKVTERHIQLSEVDANLRFLYSEAGGRLALAGGLYLLTRFLGALEVFIILRVLGIPVGFAATIFITAMVTVINTIFFMIPGQWGASEGAHMIILQALGFPAAPGLGLGVIRRIRKLAFAPLGLIFFNLEKSARPPRAAG